MFHVFGHPVAPSNILEHIEGRWPNVVNVLHTILLQCSVCYIEMLCVFGRAFNDNLIAAQFYM